MPSESVKKRQAQKKERDRQRQRQASAKKKQKEDQVNGTNGDVVNGGSEGACATADPEEVKSKIVDKKTAARSCTGQVFAWRALYSVYCPNFERCIYTSDTCT